jgi:hypothetical protein
LCLLGDFNLHSPEWDLECDKVDAKATVLANGAAKVGLILLNDNDKPTWTQPGKTPSVIDLAFMHMDLLPKHAPSFAVDIANRVADHAALTLEFSNVPENRHLKQSLPPDSMAYNRFISEATDILTNADVEHLDKTADRIANTFEKHSVIIQSKPLPGWWNDTCSDAKAVFRSSRLDSDKKRWYDTMKRAKNAFCYVWFRPMPSRSVAVTLQVLNH